MKELNFKELSEQIAKLTDYINNLTEEEIENGNKTLKLFYIFTEFSTGEGDAEFEDFCENTTQADVKKWCDLHYDDEFKLEIEVAKALYTIQIIESEMEAIKSIIKD